MFSFPNMELTTQQTMLPATRGLSRHIVQYQRSGSESTIIASISPPLAPAGPFKRLADSPLSPPSPRTEWADDKASVSELP
jgi:hypothetical protein